MFKHRSGLLRIKLKFIITFQGYPTSSIIRGRVLIISNKYSSALRRGAKQDFKNLKRMFESFHFDVVGDHKDYTAQVTFPMF